MAQHKNTRKHKTAKKRSIILPVIAAVSLTAVIVCIIFLMRFYGNIKSVLTLEAGSPLPLPEDFMDEPSDSVSCEADWESIDTLIPGDYKVTFRQGLLKKTSTLRVQDTIPPTATPKNLEVPVGMTITPEDFISECYDITAVTSVFLTTPDTSATGVTTVNIRITDLGGNSTDISATLTVYDDTEAPVITGTRDLSFYTGEMASYREGIKVKDDQDPDPSLAIDSSEVDLDTPGIYNVTYTATDSHGNSSSVTVKVTVIEKPSDPENEAKLRQKADDLLEKLDVSGMNVLDKAYTIFIWVRTNIPWLSGRVRERDEITQALRGLSGNSGDCYTFAVTCKTLLERAGFEVKFMERHNDIGDHFWLMVKVCGNWYHMDPSPIYNNQFVCFLGTDEQMKWFSTEIRPGYYDFDRSLYPSTPAEPGAVVEFLNNAYYIKETNIH